jgi:hypothetical protein
MWMGVCMLESAGVVVAGGWWSVGPPSRFSRRRVAALAGTSVIMRAIVDCRICMQVVALVPSKGQGREVSRIMASA